MNQTEIVNTLVEVRLPTQDNFLKIVETLTRLGISSRYENKLYQSVHLLCKYKTRYFLCHFKQMFMLDGKPTDLTENDLARLNTIANLLESWGLVEIVNPEQTKHNTVPLSQIKIISHKEKCNWELVAKYTIGNKGKNRDRDVVRDDYKESNYNDDGYRSRKPRYNDDDKWNR